VKGYKNVVFFLFTVMVFILVSYFCSTVVMADSESIINVEINGTPLLLFDDQVSIVYNGHILVPVRSVFEKLGFEVTWNKGYQQASLTRGGDTVIITIASDVFTINGKSHDLDIPALIVRGRTMISFSAVVESVGYAVRWTDKASTVEIFTNPLAVALLNFFASGIETPHPFNTYTSLVGLDSLGTQGVVAIRREGHYNDSFITGKIFYFYEDELFYRDLGLVDGFPFVLATTFENRIFLFGGDGGQWSYVLFELYEGRLVYSFSIVGQMSQDTYSHELYYVYYFLIDNYWDKRIPIAEYEFNNIRIQYGLDRRLYFPWQYFYFGIPDDTENILAMEW
jgi:hypothetical protein